MGSEALQELQKTQNTLMEAVKGGQPGGKAGSFMDGVNLESQISTLADLQEKAPELYDKMIEATMRNILHQIGGHQRRMKRAMAAYKNM